MTAQERRDTEPSAGFLVPESWVKLKKLKPTSEPKKLLADDLIDAIEEETGEHLSQELETRIRALEASNSTQMKRLVEAVEAIERARCELNSIHQGRFFDRQFPPAFIEAIGEIAYAKVILAEISNAEEGKP